MSTADEVQFLELEIGEQPDMNGWYWTDKPRPSVPDGGGIQDVEGLHGPFKTEQEAVAHYRATRPLKISVEQRGDNWCVLAEGSLVARRGRSGTPQAGTWIAVEPGWQVSDMDDGKSIEVIYHTAQIIPFPGAKL
jgi:hypothetical protein